MCSRFVGITSNLWATRRLKQRHVVDTKGVFVLMRLRVAREVQIGESEERDDLRTILILPH
jgi:hypothetical protein